jgi:hypothetical protein
VHAIAAQDFWSTFWWEIHLIICDVETDVHPVSKEEGKSNWL